MEEKKSILLIYTGGTIGMLKNPVTGSLSPFDFDKMFQLVPALKGFGFNLKAISFEKPIDSSDLSPELWIRLVNIIKENYFKYNGFVILHGTDTMAFSAAALSFMLENLSKPVIFTGSQLPIETLRTDGKENLITSIEIAAASKNGKSIVPEVCIYFENKLFRGNRTTKLNSEYFNAFDSPNYPPLAEAGINLKYNYDYIHYPKHQKIIRFNTKLDNNIAILKLFPGISKKVVEAVLSVKDIKAIIIETYGSGNASTEKWFIELLKNAISKNIIILNVTQCKKGRVIMGKYETSTELKNIGVISGYDIISEAAVTKLSFLLGKNLSYNETIIYLNASISGEISTK